MERSFNCDLMQTVSTSPVLLSVLFIQTTISLVSLPLLLITIRIVIGMNLIHHNTKTVLFVFLLALILQSTSRVALHGIDLINFNLPYSSCSARPSETRCVLMRGPVNFSMFLACTATITIAFERIISTWKATVYESNRSIGYFLIIVQSFLAVSLFAMMYRKVRRNLKLPIYYCIATSPDEPLVTIGPIIVLITLQISAVIILKILRYVNEMKSTQQKLNPNLRERYNIEENLRTVTIVTPFCYVSCIFTSVFLIILCTILYFNHIFSKPVYFALVDGSMLLPTLSLLLPVIIKRMNDRFNQKSNDVFQLHIIASKNNEIGNVYFNSLSWAWQSEMDKQMPSVQTNV